MIEFLFEIYSEEIPARFQEEARIQLAKLFEKHSTTRGLIFQNLITHVTPMRLVLATQVAPSIPAQDIEKRGPRIGAPEQALQGFCASVNMEKEQLTQRDGYYFAMTQIPEKTANDLLPEIVQAIFRDFSWGKTMRWPQATLSWVRPVRHIMTILDGKHLSFDIADFGLHTSDNTFGHRFLSPEKIHVTSFAGYKESLKKAHVIVDEVERKKLIQETLKETAKKEHLTVVEDEGLLEEVTGLVEYPGIFFGKLDPALFSTPEVVMITSMRVHQKCFAFRGQDGKLAPAFAAIINTIPKDGGKAIRQGYEMGMLKARLEDARFFYDLDLKTSLLDHLPKLDKIVYHEKLGTLGDRIRRQLAAVKTYTQHFEVPQETLEKVIKLSKCDLVTHMVGEFEELQGVMGEIYSRAQGEVQDIARAILDHYKPMGQSDDVPTATLSIAVALVDKIDTLVGFIGVGILPTGSKDPFALRRCALGVIRIILDNHIDIDLATLIEAARTCYEKLSPQTTVEVLNFIRTRFGFALREKGIAHDVVAACLGKEGETSLNLLKIHQTSRELTTLLSSPSGHDLMEGYRRAFNILTAEKKKDRLADAYPLNPEHLRLQQEKNLLNAINALPPTMAALGTLKDPIHAFFNDVMVNDPDSQVRLARLGLLEAVVNVFHTFSNFEKIEG